MAVEEDEVELTGEEDFVVDCEVLFPSNVAVFVTVTFTIFVVVVDALDLLEEDGLEVVKLMTTLLLLTAELIVLLLMLLLLETLVLGGWVIDIVVEVGADRRLGHCCALLDRPPLLVRRNGKCESTESASTVTMAARAESRIGEVRISRSRMDEARG